MCSSAFEEERQAQTLTGKDSMPFLKHTLLQPKQ